MWNAPTEEELAMLPAFFSTEHVSVKEKIILMHFFIGGCDWYAVEYEPSSRTFFGFVILNDMGNAEWGYFNFDEMQDIKISYGLEIDRDLYWEPTKAKDVPKISEAQRWYDVLED